MSLNITGLKPSTPRQAAFFYGLGAAWECGFVGPDKPLSIRNVALIEFIAEWAVLTPKEVQAEIRSIFDDGLDAAGRPRCERPLLVRH
jgi:hypothetical protein